MKLSPTQRQLLAVLRYIRDKGEALIPEANARALGGLTAREMDEMRGVYPSGEYVTNIATRTSAHIPGASIRTFYALADAGLVACVGGVWMAKL